MERIWKSTETAVGKATRAAASFCLGIVFVLFLLNIATRIPFVTWNPVWIDETIQFFLVWMIFLGTMELSRIGAHFMVDLLTDSLHGRRSGRVLRLISVLISLVTYATICYFGMKLCQRSSASMFTLQFMKKSYFYASIPFSAFFMSLYSVRDLILALQDLFTGGAVTRRMDEEKAAQIEEDSDAKAISEAASALQMEQDHSSRQP
ncbi:MAG: TRAP transporter small permease subunit [Pseudoflavonifractor sp.]|nr:TRAP transporter small permease subunit [Pseudoflavonifractor sp.]